MKNLTKATSADKYQKQRVKISNLVARSKEIKKLCCICGEKGNILHNKENPYLIAFICNKCRKDPYKLKEAENHRIDLRQLLDKKNLSTKLFTPDEKDKLMEEFNQSDLNIGQFCNEKEISRHQFAKIESEYKK